PTRVAPTPARDSSLTLSESLDPLLSPYSALPLYSYSSSPLAGGVSGRSARLTPPTGLVADTSTSSKHRGRNTILGAAIGLVAAANMGGGVGPKAHPCGAKEWGGAPLAKLGAGFVGGLFGMTIGAFVGLGVSRCPVSTESRRGDGFRRDPPAGVGPDKSPSPP